MSVLSKAIENIVLPIATRMGVATSGLLVGFGVATDHAASAATVVQTAVVVGALVAVDLVSSYMRRKQVAKQAVLDAN